MPLDIQAWQELSIDTPFDRIRYVMAEIASQILDGIEYIFPTITLHGTVSEWPKECFMAIR